MVYSPGTKASLGSVSLQAVPSGSSQRPSNNLRSSYARCGLDIKGLPAIPALSLSSPCSHPLSHLYHLLSHPLLSFSVVSSSLTSWLCSCLSACLHVHSSVPAPFSRSSLLSLPPGSPFVPDLLMRNYTGSIPWHGSHRCLPASLYSITGSVENVPPQGWF